MRIAFCTPFKPLDNLRPSGDVTIPLDLIAALRHFGHEVVLVPYFPCRELWQDSDRMQRLPEHLNLAESAARGCDCLLTYSSYYKVPDAVGPRVAARLNIPYYIFQASYAPSRGEDDATWPGFVMNELAMLAAEYVFCNSPDLEEGCARLLPPNRFGPVRPGFDARSFLRDEMARERLRREWNAEDAVVVGCAAMMRPGVKARGVEWLVRAVGNLRDSGVNAVLAVAGEGDSYRPCRDYAAERLGPAAIFPGTVERDRLPGFYSALDVFAFPGLRESVGMVYLEAQACGVPCVATDDLGAPRVIADGRTGLVSSTDEAVFAKALARLVDDAELRKRMGDEAAELVRERHDARKAYREVERILLERTP